MNFYFGLIDTENLLWGFVEETDDRAWQDAGHTELKPNMIFVSEQDHQRILDENSEAGKEIVGYNNECFVADKGRYIIDENGLWQVNENYEQEKAAKREADFDKAFFNTSLGYVRRLVTMADGSHKDFLSDLLPVISMGVQAGTPVNILTYDRPPFDHDIDDWTEYQNQVVVTAQFIQECFLQLSNDFLPINEEE